MTTETEIMAIGKASQNHPTCALYLLGAFALSVGAHSVQLSSRKGQLLLARLATERGKAMTRQQLAAFLWPDHGGNQARASLRQALSRLRDALGPAAPLLQSDATSVCLNDASLDLDIDTLSSDLSIARLCSLGEFLEGVQVAEPALQEWMESERRHQSERLMAALAARAEASEQGGDHENVIRLTLRQITLDPLNEAAHRRLMMAFSNSRRSSRAMEQYQTLQTLLRCELDVAPEKETTELYHRIRNERASIPSGDARRETSDATVEESFHELRLVTILCTRLDTHVNTSGAYKATIERLGGEQLHSTERDACFLFGLKSSREDDVFRALKAATTAISDQPELAVGMALGLVSKDEDGIQGEPMRRAESLAFMAAPGEVLSGSFLRNQARGWADFAEEDLRGQKIWRLIRVQRAPLRPQLPFVGRKIEFLHLSAIQDEAAHGNGAIAILSGSAGIGKTRITEELEARATAATGLVLRLEFAPSTGNKEPLQFRIAAKLAARLNLSSIKDLPSLDTDQNEFAKALFAEGQQGAHRPAFAGASPAVATDMAINAICAMLDHVPDAGLTLILDDCHWATSEEIVFLTLFFRRIHEHRLFVVATERATEEQLRPALQAQSMETPVHVTMLSPLRMSEALALARTVTGETNGDDARIVEHAAGNPLFTIRLAEASDELGDAIPTSVIALAQHQLDRLDDQTRRLCQNAAVLGRSFSGSDAAQIFGPAFVSTTVTSGFLNMRGEDVEFDHALIQQAIYEATPLPQRQAAHAAAANHFKSFDAFKWAEHAVASGDCAVAATASIAAAIEAVSQNRFAVAERFVVSGLSTGCTDDDQAELQRSLADIRRDQGQIEEAIALYRDAGDIAESASVRLRSLVGQAWMLRYQGSSEEAATVFANAQRISESHDVSDLSRCDFLAELGNRAFVAGDAKSAFAAHSEGLELSQRNGHATQTARALGGLGDAHYAAFELITAHRRYGECIEFAERHNLGMVANAHRHMLSYTAFFVKPGDEALALARAAIDRAVAEGNARNEFAARVDFLDYLALDQDFESFADQLMAIDRLLESIGDNRFQSDIDGAKCTRALLLGDFETLHDISNRYISLPPSPYIWPAFVALHACSLSDINERLRWLEKGEAQVSKACLSHALIFFHHFAAEAVRDMPDLAVAYAQKLKDRSGTELCGFVDLSIRTTLLRAETNPDQTAIATLREDLVNAHLTGFWPALFSNQ